MERPEIKGLIEKMEPSAVLVFTGDKEEMTVVRSELGNFWIGGLPFDAVGAATWVESIRPHSVVDDTDFHSMQIALKKMKKTTSRTYIFNGLIVSNKMMKARSK